MNTQVTWDMYNFANEQYGPIYDVLLLTEYLYKHMST